MDTYSHKFKLRLGLFIVGGIILFLVAIFYIGKRKNLFDPVFKVTANFYNVSGLQVGNNVRFSGINVGTVDFIRIINDSTVQVEMLIRQEVQQFIKSDSKVTLGSDGIIGDRVLIITHGSSNAPQAKNGQMLTSKEPVETDAIMASLQVTADNTAIVTGQLSEMLMNVNRGNGPLGRLIRDSTMGENINQTIVSFNRSSRSLNKSMNQVSGILASVQKGEGTMGRLLTDTAMGNDISQTIFNLRKSSEGLNENIEALKDNVLFRGYFKKKAKAEEKQLKDREEKELDDDLKKLNEVIEDVEEIKEEEKEKEEEKKPAGKKKGK